MAVVLVAVRVQVQALVAFQLLRLHLPVVWVGAAFVFVEVCNSAALKDVGAAGPGELLEGLGRQDGSAVVDGFGVVSLVNGDGGVDDLRSVDFLLDHGLDVLVHMVVDVLASDDGSGGG